MTTRLPGHLVQRVELQPDALLAQPLVGLDERPPDVAVLDQALREVDPARAGEADRGRRAGIRDRQHEVGLDRRLLREPLAHAHARSVDLDARQPRVGPREIEELEDAERPWSGRDGLKGVQAVLVDDHELARRDVALELGADEVERARLRGDNPVAVEASQAQRPEAVGVAERDEPALRERDDRVRAVEPFHRRGDRLRQRRRVAGDQRGDHVRCRSWTGAGSRAPPAAHRR